MDVGLLDFDWSGNGPTVPSNSQCEQFLPNSDPSGVGSVQQSQALAEELGPVESHFYPSNAPGITFEQLPSFPSPQAPIIIHRDHLGYYTKQYLPQLTPETSISSPDQSQRSQHPSPAQFGYLPSATENLSPPGHSLSQQCFPPVTPVDDFLRSLNNAGQSSAATGLAGGHAGSDAPAQLRHGCDVAPCQARFKTLKELKRHKGRLHQPVDDFQCRHCGKVVGKGRSDNAQRHERKCGIRMGQLRDRRERRELKESGSFDSTEEVVSDCRDG